MNDNLSSSFQYNYIIHTKKSCLKNYNMYILCSYLPSAIINSTYWLMVGLQLVQFFILQPTQEEQKIDPPPPLKAMGYWVIGLKF